MTSAGFFPLLEVFQELRHRDFPLGIDDYVLALRAMESGIGTGSRADLVLMCQSLWAQSAEECEQIADVLDGVLPLPVSQEDLGNPELLPAGPGRDPAVRTVYQVGSPAYLDRGTGSAPASDDAAAEEHASDRPDRDSGGGVAGAQPGERMDYRRTWISGATATGTATVPGRRPLPRTWQLNPRFDFIGSLPVTTRQISQAWRRYRRMSRTGQRTEYDAAATVAQFHRDGILLAPILIPPRTNQARLLILEDVGGSMTPFRYITSSLVTGAQHVGLARVDVRYFHDVPWDVVFRDPDQLASVPLDDAVAPFANGAILICSDAGAARGSLDYGRANQTAGLLAVLRRHTTAIAWVNPVPRDRWPGTTAEAISNLEDDPVPMFPLDRAGLTDAVNVLRGRRY